MNLKELAKHEDRIYRIEPPPLSKVGAKLTLSRFNQWKIHVQKARGVIQIRNISTSHQLDLGLDHYYDFRTPNFLMLKCRLIMEGASLHIKPLPDPRASASKRLRP